jgi:hypothetical protein
LFKKKGKERKGKEEKRKKEEEEEEFEVMEDISLDFLLTEMVEDCL